MHPEEARVDVEHRLTNTNLWTVELAPWALSVMAPGGRAIIPLPPKGTHPEHLLPNGNITLWAYTDMADPRWRWGTNFVFLDQDESAANPQKAGFFVEKGRAAYQNGEDVFIKHFRTEKGAKYPDRNVNVELFTNAEMLELETLGPLTSIAPGKSVVHTETWQMQRTTNALTKEEIPDFVLQKIT